MKLVSLNTWAGKELNPLLEFLAAQAEDTDVFCFQEVTGAPHTNQSVGEYRPDLFSRIQESLPKHRGSFAPSQPDCHFAGFPEPVPFGLAMFVREGLEVDHQGDIFLYGERGSNGPSKTERPRNLQYVVLNNEPEAFTVAHMHGLWNGKGKTDTPERIQQSTAARKFLDRAEGKTVFCGDFNLLPDTRSLAILTEENVDLIRRYGITTTRSPLYTKPDKFADYTIISRDVNVQRFKVPEVEVSDHLPMILEFS